MAEDTKVYPQLEDCPPRVSDLKARGFGMQTAISILAKWDALSNDERERILPSLGSLTI